MIVSTFGGLSVMVRLRSAVNEGFHDASKLVPERHHPEPSVFDIGYLPGVISAGRYCFCSAMENRAQEWKPEVG